jgi:hypothetical protein
MPIIKPRRMDAETDTVKDTWNIIENKLINIVDKLIPETEFKNNITCKIKVPPNMISELNRRKNLLRKFKINKTMILKEQISSLDKEIKSTITRNKGLQCQEINNNRNTKSLWKAVKVARNINVNTIPDKLCINGTQIKDSEKAEAFATFFDEKIKSVLNTVNIKEDHYNGNTIVNSEDKMFMDKIAIIEVMKSLKPKNSEGFDRIPQRILLDGIEHLILPFEKLFSHIYKSRKVPDQWLIAKTIPIYKNKGDPHNIINYRPIANLCSTSKVFEKMILRRILEIQEQNKVDLTRKGQHGFKKKRITSTLSIELQSVISRALDEDEYVMVASLDLSAAFDVVNINLLLKRLRIIGLPNDLIELISVWLKDRSYYVSLDGINSVLRYIHLGTVQGSVLGPVLYAIFVSPLFDIIPILSFADDSYNIVRNKDKNELVKDMEITLESITNWLRSPGLKSIKRRLTYASFTNMTLHQLQYV